MNVPAIAVTNRVKLALAVLMPALWLFASGQSLLAYGDECTFAGVDSSQASLDSGKSFPHQPFCGSDAAAMGVHARLVKHLGKGSPSYREHFCSLDFLLPLTAALRAARENSPDLVSSWQFACRAALDPRAPSCIS
jgi:hypothetical protein